MENQTSNVSGSVVNLVPNDGGGTAQVIEALDDLMRRARAGEIVAIAVALVVRGGRDVETVWTEGDAYHQLNSGAARLAHEIASAEYS